MIKKERYEDLIMDVNIATDTHIQRLHRVRELILKLLPHLQSKCEDIIRYDNFFAIEVKSLNQVTKVRKVLREYFGYWKDHVASINMPFVTSLKMAEEENSEVYVRYHPDIGKKDRYETYLGNQGLVKIWLKYPYNKFPKEKFSKSSNCSLKEQVSKYISFSCEVK